MLQNIRQRVIRLARRRVSFERLAWTLIGLGVLLRLTQYAANRSLWNDEALLALNIIPRSFGGLLQPLDYGQGAPVGFLVAEKLVVDSLGASEYALRLIPLISGLLSVLLFYEVARRSIGPRATLVGLGLFAILGPLVYYSSEVKQYSSDVAIALLVFLCTHGARQGGGLGVPSALTLAFIGGISVWCSHPGVFVLASVGAVVLTVSCRNRDWVTFGRFSIVALIWALSFVVFYDVSLRHLRDDRYLVEFWRSEFFPSRLSPASLDWLWHALLRIFDNPVGLYHLPQLAAFACLGGAVALWKQNRMMVLALTLPLIYALAASAARLYPFGDRLLLFAVPFILLLIGTGVERILRATQGDSSMIGILLVVLLFFNPVGGAAFHLLKPRIEHGDIKPVMAYLRAHEETGDTLYLLGACPGCTNARYPVPSFAYYAGRYGFAPPDAAEGTIVLDSARWTVYATTLDRLKGKRRVWVLFSNLPEDARDFFVHYLDTKGTRLDAFVGQGAAVYLYDLTKKNNHRS